MKQPFLDTEEDPSAAMSSSQSPQYTRVGTTEDPETDTSDASEHSDNDAPTPAVADNAVVVERKQEREEDSDNADIAVGGGGAVNTSSDTASDDDHAAAPRRNLGAWFKRMFSTADSARPSSAKWVQQTVPTWSMVLHPTVAAGVFTSIGIICFMFAAMTSEANNHLFQLSFQYGGRADSTHFDVVDSLDNCSTFVEADTEKQLCNVSVVVPSQFLPQPDDDSLPDNATRFSDVYLYYQLTRFNQNHRL